MLPFLAKKQVAGVIISKRKSDLEKPESEKDDPSAALDACSSELIEAVKLEDEKGVSAALRAAFQILDSEPHEEGPQNEEEAGE